MEGFPLHRVAVISALLAGPAGAGEQPRGLEGLLRSFGSAGIQVLRAPDGTAGMSVDRDTGATAAYLDGNPSIVIRGIRLEADRIAVLQGPEPPAGGGRPVEIYAEGNVRLSAEGGAFGRAVLRADAIAFDSRTLRGQAVNVRGIARAEARARIQFRARAMRFEMALARVGDAKARFQLRRLLAEDAAATNCDFAAPHWGIRARRVEIEGQPPPSRDLWIRAPGNWLEIHGARVLPLPRLTWNTAWLRRLPLREASYSKSGKFGHFVHTAWDTAFLPGVGHGLDALGRGLGAPTDLLAHLDYLSARGVGYGLAAESGRKPGKWGPMAADGRAYWAEFDAYAIHDRGEDRNDIVPETRDRNRIRLRYRHRLAPVGVFDAEIGRWRDANFLNEYFEREIKADKAPETLAYLRRNLGEDMAVTVLEKNRVNRFESTLERAPEGRFYLVERPLYRPPWWRGSGLYGSATIQAANLHYRPPRDADLPDARSGRFDGLGELAAPFGLSRYLRVRPRGILRWTAWDRRRGRDARGRVAAVGGGLDRFAAAGGLELSEELSRILPVRSRFFDVGALKHAIIPKLDYFHRFEVTRPPEDLYPFDAIDGIDREESIGIRLENYLLARPFEGGGRAGPVRRLAEIDLGARYYPKAGRDHPRASDGRGEKFTMIEGEALLDPHPQVGAQLEWEIDPNTSRSFDVLDAVVRLGDGDPFQLHVGERFLAEDKRAGRRSESFFHVVGTVRFSEKYRFDAYFQYDFHRGRPVEEVFVLTRYFHRWAMVLSMDIDEGEERDVSLRIQFSPVELLPSLMEERDRYGYR